MKELFKPLYKVINDEGEEFNFDAQVCVSNGGSVFVNPRCYNKTNRDGYLAKARKTKQGYLQIRLADANGKVGWFYIHTLMGWAWLEKHPYHRLVMHLDDNTSNNVIQNLRWGTHKDNFDDMMSKGRNPKWAKGNKIKYSDELCLEVFNKRLNGVSIKQITKDYPTINRSYLKQLTSGQILVNRGLIQHTITKKNKVSKILEI